MIGLHLLLAVTGVFAPSPPFLLISPPGPQEVSQGRGIVLTCTLRGGSTVYRGEGPVWTAPHGASLTNNFRIYSEQEDSHTSSLFLKKVSGEDEGLYTCSLGRLKATTTVTVRVGVQFVAPPLQTLTAGMPGTLICRVVSQPPALRDWWRGGSCLGKNNLRLTEVDEGLQIDSVLREDAGLYICRARVLETGEMEEKSIQLQVIEPPEWIIRPTSLLAVEGQAVQVACSGRGSPPPSSSWAGGLRGHLPLPQGVSVDSEGTLVIHNISVSLGGVYVCTVRNNAGSIRAEVQVDVLSSPQVWVEGGGHKTLVEGHGGSVDCRGSGEPLPSLQWFRGEDPLGEKEGGEEGQGRASLNLQGVTRQDSGIYRCVGWSSAGRADASLRLTVQHPPGWTNGNQPSTSWSWDQRPVTLVCHAQAEPPAQLSWWVNTTHQIGRHVLNKNFKIRGLEQKSELRVAPLSDIYYQDYLCRATNKLGQAEKVFVLSKARKPGPIQQVILELVTPTALRFQFVEPVDTGGLKVESYTAEYKEARQNWSLARRRHWFQGQEGRFSLEDLQPWTAYHLRFSCRTPVGQSPWGNNLEITLPRPTVPAPPNLSLGEGLLDMAGRFLLSNKSATVSWEWPDGNPGLVDHCSLSLLETESNSSSRDQTVNWGEQPLVHFLLAAADTVYRIAGRCHNQVGYSKETTIWARSPQGELVGELQVAPSSSLSLPLLLLLTLTLLSLSLLSVDFALCMLRDKGILFKGCTFVVSNVYRKSGRRSRR